MQLLSIRSFILILFAIMLAPASACGQVFKRSAAKIRSLKNISYTDIVQMKFSFQDNFSVDTLQSALTIVPTELSTGGYYAVKSRQNRYLYDGDRSVTLNLSDSTYKVASQSVTGQNTRTLLYWAGQMERFSRLPPNRVVLLPDTVINAVSYSHLRVTVNDTLINKEHCYTFLHFVIDKSSLLPHEISSQLRGVSEDGSVLGCIEIHSYSNYFLNKKDFPDLSFARIPDNFKLPEKPKPVIPLAAGTSAPSLDGLDLSGARLSLDAYKGKAVLLNFGTIGCPHCVAAAQMLSNLHDQFNDKGLVIINVYPHDSRDAIARFDNRFHVKSRSITTDKRVQDSYPHSGYPSFYLLDGNGRVTVSYNGYYKELQAEITRQLKTMIQ